MAEGVSRRRWLGGVLAGLFGLNVGRASPAARPPRRARAGGGVLGRTVYVYDRSVRLTSVTGGPGPTRSFVYGPEGRAAG